MSFLSPSATGQKCWPQLRSREAGSHHYFAYGSNLAVAQMAQRCPESEFVGKATLPAYRWQINQRGVANVVESADHSVEGLLYLVTPMDKRALDRAEGISKAFYEPRFLTVIFEPHRQFAYVKSSGVAQLLADRQLSASEDPEAMTKPERPSSSSGELSAKCHSEHGQPSSTEQQVEALVYVSENYKDDGQIREEYIIRMKKATSDAVTLGVSQSFVDIVINPWLDPGKIGSNEGRPDSPARQPIEAVPGDAARRTAKRQHGDLDSDSSPFNLVDFSKLKESNRKLHIDSGIRFPTELLDKIGETSSRTARQDEYARTYLVLAEEGAKGAKSPFRVLAVTQDLDLANELALTKFRDLLCQHRQSLPTDSTDQWTNSDGRDDRDGPLKWWQSDDAYIHLHATIPGKDNRISVWVETQVLAARA